MTEKQILPLHTSTGAQMTQYPKSVMAQLHFPWAEVDDGIIQAGACLGGNRFG